MAAHEHSNSAPQSQGNKTADSGRRSLRAIDRALADPRTHATLVIADPPRSSWLALWRPDGAIEGTTESVEIVRPGMAVRPISELRSNGDAKRAPGTNSASGTQTQAVVEPRSLPETNGNSEDPAAAEETTIIRVQPLPTPVLRASMRDLIDAFGGPEDLLTTLSSPGTQSPGQISALGSLQTSTNVQVEEPATTPSRSIISWATATRSALSIISTGLLRPSATPAGTDSWQLGPLDHAQNAHIQSLALSLPAEAHSHSAPETTAQPGEDPVITSAETAIRIFMDGIADRFVRTSAARLGAGHPAFAEMAPTTVDPRSALSALGGDKPPLLTLRLCPPTEPEGNFSAALFFQSRKDTNLTVSAAALWAAPESVRRRFSQVETSLLLTLRRAAKVWKPIDRFLAQSQPAVIELATSELEELERDLSNDLGAVGLSVLWPTDMVGSIDFRPVVGASKTDQQTSLTGRTSRMDLASLLELRWRGEIDGKELTDEELTELAESKRSIVRLRGQWVRISADEVDRLNQRRSVGASAALAAALGGTVSLDGGAEAGGYDIEVEGPLATLGERLRGLDLLRSIDPPEGFLAELRPYQHRGLAWMAEMDDLGLGGILADDMGLGKTVQLLALHSHRQQTRSAPTLVICPTSVVGNWERETKRFSPGIPVIRYHGTTRHLGDVPSNAIVLTSYGVARRDASELTDVGWGLMIADEAQAIKNPRSRTARSLRQISAETRFALTGTPIQNQLSDLWAILDWSTPGLLGPLERFRRELAAPIERDGDPEVTAQLNRLLRPFLLRRRKTDPDIAPDLPPKTETDEIVPLTGEQATLYKAVVTEVMAEIADATGISRRGLVLRLVTRLKQVCNHPEHLLAEDGELAGRSGKLEATSDLLRVITDEGERTLIFTQYVAMGHLLVRHLQSLGFRTLFLHGGLSINERERMVEQFQRGEIDAFVVSLRAGGTGLNLTAASHVIHYDRWWNPAVEDQASDRVWRLGQDRPVQIHRLICEGTIEDRIAAMLKDKRAIAEAVVGSGEGWISELSDQDLADLVALSDDKEEE